MTKDLRYRPVVKQTIFENMAALMDIDAKKGTTLITNSFHDDHDTVMNELANNEKLMYSYLKGISESLLEGKMDPSVVASPTEEKEGEEAIEDEAKKRTANLASLFSEKEEETFIGLQCKFEPKLVCQFLKTHNNYRPETTLKMVSAAGINDACAYVYEKMSNLPAALNLHIQSIQAWIQEAEPAILNAQPGKIEPFNEDTYPNCKEEKNLHTALLGAIDLCARHSNTILEKESETLWFQVLDSVSRPLARYKTMPVEQQGPGQTGPQGARPGMRARGAPVVKADRLRRGFTLLVQLTLQNMMGHLPLAVIVQKMVADSGKESFGSFRNIFMSMLDVTSYERNILHTTNRLLDGDVFLQAKELMKWRTKAFAPTNVVQQAPLQQVPVASAANVGQPQEQPGAVPHKISQEGSHKSSRSDPENYTEPQSESKMGLLAQLLGGANLVPPADFGGVVNVEKITNLDQRKIGLPQTGKLNPQNVKQNSLPLDQQMSLFGRGERVH